MEISTFKAYENIEKHKRDNIIGNQINFCMKKLKKLLRFSESTYPPKFLYYTLNKKVKITQIY